MKKNIRNRIIAVAASVLVAAGLTTIFVVNANKSKEPTTSVDLVQSVVSTTSDTTTSVPTSINLVGGTMDAFYKKDIDQRCKYWYDKKEVQDAQAEKYEHIKEVLASTEKLYEDKYDTFDVYNLKGYATLISGRDTLYITDLKDVYEIRNTDTGELRYDTLKDDVVISKDLKSSDKIEDYQDKPLAQFGEGVTYEVYLNNIKVSNDFVYNEDHVMPISDWLDSIHLADFKPSKDMVEHPELYNDLADEPVLKLVTAAGNEKFTFKSTSKNDFLSDADYVQYKDGWRVDSICPGNIYDDSAFTQIAKKEEIVITVDKGKGILSMSPEAIETILGFSINVDHDAKTVNIITDNKDRAFDSSLIEAYEKWCQDKLQPVVSEPEPEPEPKPVVSQPQPEPEPEPKPVESQPNPQPVVSEPEPEPEPDPAPAWTETPVSGTMYVNLNGIYNRKQAIQGSEKVRQFTLNEEVTVTAKTNTDYYKIEDGTFIHSDYLSSSKIVYEEPKPATPITPSGNGPVTGDRKTENGKTYVYNELCGWVEDHGPSTHESAGVEPDPSRNHPMEGAY